MQFRPIDRLSTPCIDQVTAKRRISSIRGERSVKSKKPHFHLTSLVLLLEVSKHRRWMPRVKTRGMDVLHVFLGLRIANYRTKTLIPLDGLWVHFFQWAISRLILIVETNAAHICEACFKGILHATFDSK